MNASPAPRASLRLLLETVGFAAVVAFSQSLVPRPGEASIWWPPIGAVVAWLLARPNRDWPMVVLLAAAVRIGAVIAVGNPLLASAMVLTGSMLVCLLTATLLRRLHRNRAPFSDPWDIVAVSLIAVCLTGPLAAANIALMRATLSGVTITWLSPVHWSLSESTGVMLVTPLVLTLGQARAWWQVNGASRRAELVLQLLASLTFGVVVMFAPADQAESRRPLLALLALPSAWGAIRFGLFSVCWSQFITATIGAWGLLSDRGVIAALPNTIQQQALQLQVFTLVAAVSIMLAAAAFESQRRALARARASEADFRRLVDASPVGMLVESRADGDVPFHNARLAALFGDIDGTQPMAVWWTRIGATSDLPQLLEDAEARSRAPGEITSTPITADLRGADGAARHVELHVSAVGDRRIIAFVDLTDRARVEAEQRTSHKLEALGTLAGGVAHDFNNILTAIMGNLALMRGALPAGHETRPWIDDATSASKRATDMVRQILTFSRQQEHDRSVLALSPVFLEAASHLRSLAPAAVRVQVAEGRDVPHVLGDATQLHQVIMNLGANALHAMRERGGTLSLALEKVDVTEDLVRRHPELRTGRYARLTVGDTGVGMTKETLERVFEPFFTTKHPGEGTGLGLAVVHGVAKSHDGAIIARSTPGEGTWFGVYLPATSEVLPWQAPADDVPISLHGVRVLAVDDEPALARLVHRVVTRAGGIARTVSRPQELLSILREDPLAFDVLITDLSMVGTSGIEVAAEARRIRPSLPVLLMTGYSATLSLDALRADGIAGVLQKPFTPDEAVCAIAEVTAAQQGQLVAVV